jgi:2-hydroxychromene-2-carboxylate isomerase
MVKEVEFFFDVGSPYSYLAYRVLPGIAAARGAQIRWRPMLLGGVFKATGNSSPIAVPAKGRYSGADLKRWARAFGVPFVMNPNFPINTLPIMRGAVGVQRRGEAELRRYLDAMYGAMFEHPRNLGDPEVVGAVLREAGFDPLEVLAMTQDEAVKDGLRTNTEEAVARGVFGAPTFFVGDEMFWGQDRLQFVDQALA